MKLSAREKKFVNVLIVFLVAVGLLVVLRYLSNYLDGISEQYSDVKYQSEYIQATIAQADAQQEQLDTLSNNAQQAAQGFYEYLSPTQLDAKLTGLMRANGMLPLSLNMSSAVLGTPGGSDSASEDSPVTFCFVEVSLSCYGSREALLNFMQSLQDSISIEVNSFTASGTAESMTASVNMSVYMYIPLEEYDDAAQ